MTWAKFDDSMATHPKCAPLSDVAFRLMIHANLWARRWQTGGFVPSDMLPTILPGRTARALAAAAEELSVAGVPLHSVGLWERADGGWQIHDFDHYGAPQAAEDHQPEVPRPRVDPELSRKRADAGRRGGQASGFARRRPEQAVASNDVQGEAGAGVEQATSSNLVSNPASLFDHDEAKSGSGSDPDPDPSGISPKPPEASGSKAAEDTGNGSSVRFDADQRTEGCTVLLGDRASQFLKSSRAAMARYGSPLDWPEVQAVWSVFESTWGKADRPRDINDPRMKLVLERYAAGRTPEELARAIRASKLYRPVADNPAFQRLKTILRDDEQVDSLLRLPDAPVRGDGHVRAKQQGGWCAPATEWTS